MKIVKYRCLPVLLIALFTLAGFTATAQAAYEVSGVTFDQPVTTDRFVQAKHNDLTVSWTAPTMSGGDQIMGYFLIINTSSTPLTVSELDDKTYDFKTVGTETSVIIPKETFAQYDSDKLRYLHIRTQYLEAGTQTVKFSNDVVSAAIRIDNVAPTGTLTLDPRSGTTKIINVTIVPTAVDTKYYWLNDRDSFPGGTGTDYTLFRSGTVELREGTPYGNVTIYAWFEDLAGNRTSAASATAIYDYKAPVAIQYSSSTVAVDATLGFTVDGTTTYNWTLTDMAAGVAEFVEASTGVASVTVKGKKAGTFTVTATPTTGDPLKTGTITVVQTATTRQYNLVTGLNTISLSRSGTGWVKAVDLANAVGTNCQSIIRWDASKQGFVAHIKGTPLNNFDLADGDGYFVNVTAPVALSLTGQTVSRTFNLLSGLNLVGMPDSKAGLTKAADLAGNVGDTCQSIIKWDASKQGFVAHIKGTPLNNYDVSAGEGYFINVNANTQWQ